MKIEHIALWVRDLDQMKGFYQTYFGATANRKYHNPTKDFYSYFLSFDDGCRLELMTIPGLMEKAQDRFLGQAHFAISVGSKESVDELTQRFKIDGIEVVDGPRTTGDGYYEAVIKDPENNLIEITI